MAGSILLQTQTLMPMGPMVKTVKKRRIWWMTQAASSLPTAE
jgi:hypothetical protein